MVTLPLVAIEGVHWASDESKFACRVDGCNASYMTKYNLVWHLRTCHNVTMEPGKPEHPSIQKQGPKVQDHMVMNARILNNPLAQFCHNEQKAITKVRKHTTLD